MNPDYPPLLDQLERGPPVRIQPLGGGCIAQAAVATFDDGSKVFVKRAAGAAEMFPREADGLNALAACGAIRLPRVLAVSAEALILEFIRPAPKRPDFSEIFGRCFARLHSHRGRTCGFMHDNFIGSTPQPNGPLYGDWAMAENDEGSGWPEFFIQRRLRYQVDLAVRKGYGAELSGLLDVAEGPIIRLLSAAIEPPSLLHGDLWAGNFMVDDLGMPCLIDPAVYYGHREADLAMTRLFGGFEPAFYAAYMEALPLTNGHEERLPVYQLYHLLNHLNLFGRSYLAQCVNILKASAKL